MKENEYKKIQEGLDKGTLIIMDLGIIDGLKRYKIMKKGSWQSKLPKDYHHLDEINR